MRIHLLSGSNLKAADVNGKSDPYVIIKHQKQKVKSKVCNATLNPNFFQHFSLDVEDMTKPLKFKVWDHDAVGSDDKLGKGSIDLNTLTSGSRYTIPLDTQGSLLVQLDFTPH
uniref:C2 domain-containing protein n=1 Tax=Arcella intermedia TaxID=1963864 RepID=A0A6B2LRY8_9EUKA